MTHDEIFGRVVELLIPFIWGGSINPGITAQTHLQSDLSLDSLDLLEFCIDVEAEFAISIHDNTLPSLTTVEAVVSEVERQLQTK